MAKKDTIRYRILEFLEQGNKLTVMEATHKFNTVSLSSHISFLRNKGYNIKTELKSNPNTGKTYGVYYMSAEIKQ